MDIKFDCNHCGQPLAVDAAGAGQIVNCPKCGQLLTVTAAGPPLTPPTPPSSNDYLAGNPSAIPPQTAAPPVIPPPVENKRKCTGWKVLLSILAILIVLAVIGNFSSQTASTPEGRVELTTCSYNRTGFGTIDVSSFTIKNGSSHDIKDITVRCDYYGKSGTRIDRNMQTIYDTIKAGDTKRFDNIRMGVIPDQTDHSSAGIQDFTTIH
jgi:hypothetical protein